MQVKLLRAIETSSIERLGSNVAVPLDIRFVAASKADLQAACRAGRFREDLYYRLNVVSLAIPPLRERREDVPLLFNHLAREARCLSGAVRCGSARSMPTAACSRSAEHTSELQSLMRISYDVFCFK